MYRRIKIDLKEWKSRTNRKPLILLGARQVGKTYIVKEFGNEEFDTFIYINCHQSTEAIELFRDMDTKRIRREIERLYDKKIVDGKTLLFFDEIQEVANGVASLKYFCEEESQLHVIVAGSLLGISLREGESYPVGKVETLRMYPMDFMEFLLARGRKGLVEMLENLEWDTMKLADKDLTEYLREYYFTGGMPEAVKEYISSGDVHKVRKIQQDIIDAYYRDISKHTKALATRIHQVWESIPAQLAKENKKFIYGAIRTGARASQFEMALQWLQDAGLIHKVELAKKPVMPLKFYADASVFKVYLLDCGLLACMSEADPNKMLIGDNAFVEFKGALTENFVLQQIKSLDRIPVYYYSKENSQLEINFIAQTNRVIPIEAKAEENTKSKSLSTFVRIENADKNLKGLRLSMKPYIDQGWMENIPLYAIIGYLKKSLNG
ncbi:MAG: ATP-binding protein [Bacteroidales bacterium]|nr:ATP-binding protein [Bacteroidales bacterium]